MRLRAVEVWQMFEEFYDGRVSENKKEVLNDLEMYLNRYNITTKFMVVLQRCRQKGGIIELDVRVRLYDDENEFIDFGLMRRI